MSNYNCHAINKFKAFVKYHRVSFQNLSMTAKITVRLPRCALPTLQPPTELQELDAYRSIGPRFPKTTTSQPPNSPRSTCATCSLQRRGCNWVLIFQKNGLFCYINFFSTFKHIPKFNIKASPDNQNPKPLQGLSSAVADRYERGICDQQYHTLAAHPERLRRMRS